MTTPGQIWICAHGGKWSPVDGGTQDAKYIRADLHDAEIARLTSERDKMGLELSLQKAENEARRRNMRETFDAMCAMRNSINEHLPMPSLESDLLQGPEDSIFCAAVAEAVVSALTVARAERDAALASSARAVVMGVWGMCEAIEDDAHEKIAMADCDHSKGFWTGQKLAAKTIRRSTEMPAQTTSTVQDATAGRVKVKPLVWEETWGGVFDDVPQWVCQSKVGRRFAFSAAGTGYASHNEAPAAWVATKKAAAQADYEARILAALEPQPITEQDAARVPETDAERFDRADWYWRAMDPDDCGDTPSEAIHRGMIGDFCVCEIASSYTGPVRYGFTAPVLDPESDDNEFLHFGTQQEAIDAAKERIAALSAISEQGAGDARA